MKKIILKNKKNIKFVIAFIFGLIVTLVIGYSTGTPEFDSIFVLYNNTNSQMTSNTVQAAIDELNTKCSGCPVGKECFNYADFEGNDFYQKFAINGYKKLKYIDHPAAVSNFYIDTGIAAANDVGVFINYSELASTGSYIFGTSGYVYTRGTANRTYNKKVYWNGNVIYQEDKNSHNTDQIHVYWNYNNSRYVNHDQVRTDITDPLGSSYTGNIFLYNKNDGTGSPSGSSAPIRLFSFVITKGKEVVRKYTPCINSSNTPGLCEEVTGTFATGSTANKFWAGPVSDERASDRFKVGDYVQMKARWYCDETAITEDITGYPATQALCSTHNKTHTWRVININPDRSVDMIMNSASENGLAFGGVTGYKHYIDTLNYVASFFSNPVYTSKTRQLGYSEVNVMDSRKLYQVPILDTPTTSNNTWYNNGNCEQEYMTVGKSSDIRFEEISNTTTLKNLVDGGYGDIGWKKDINLVLSALGTLDTPADNNTIYIASRLYANDTSTSCKYRVKTYVESWDSYEAFINTLEETTSHTITEHYPGGKIRAITTLYPTVIPLSGTGTSADPYIIN